MKTALGSGLALPYVSGRGAAGEPEPSVPQLIVNGGESMSGDFGTPPFYAYFPDTFLSIMSSGVEFAAPDAMVLELRDSVTENAITHATGRYTISFQFNYAESGSAFITAGVGDNRTDTNVFNDHNAVVAGAGVARNTGGLGTAFNLQGPHILNGDSGDLSVVASGTPKFAQLIIDLDEEEVEVYLGSPGAMVLADTLPYTPVGNAVIRVLATADVTAELQIHCFCTTAEMESVSFDMMGAAGWADQ